MPNAYIKKIKQKSTGDIIYPESKTGAIYMPDNITTLDGYLGNTDISGSGKSTISGIIGNTNISEIADGTITGALNQLNNNLNRKILLRQLQFNYTIQANSTYHRNLKTLIDADMPFGYICAGIVGYSSNNVQALTTNIGYYNSDYSLQVLNRQTSVSIASTLYRIWYLAILQ